MVMLPIWSKKEVRERTKRFLKEFKVYPSTRQLLKCPYMPKIQVIIRLYGSHINYIKSLRLPKKMLPNNISLSLPERIPEYHQRPKVVENIYKQECAEYYNKFLEKDTIILVTT